MKSFDESRERVRGFFNIAVTPFSADGEFDFAGLRANIERVLSLGVDGLLIGGTYGEFPAMSVAERAELFRRATDIVADRAPLMLCAAASDWRVARDLTRLAGELGGLPMVTPPFVTEATDSQIVAFFEELAPQSRTGILIYNAPGIGVTLSVETIERLADIANVVGVKQGDLNPTTIDRIANRLAGRLRLFCASDLVFPGPISAGFDGLSSTNSSALPELILSSYRALVAGDLSKAMNLHRSWFEFRQLAREFGQPQTVKAAMNLRGFAGGRVRPPLRDLAARAIDGIAGVLEELGLETPDRTA